MYKQSVVPGRHHTTGWMERVPGTLFSSAWPCSFIQLLWFFFFFWTNSSCGKMSNLCHQRDILFVKMWHKRLRFINHWLALGSVRFYRRLVNPRADRVRPDLFIYLCMNPIKIQANKTAPAGSVASRHWSCTIDAINSPQKKNEKITFGEFFQCKIPFAADAWREWSVI